MIETSKLERVAVRLIKEPPLLFNEPLDNVQKVVSAVAEELGNYDREVVAVLNMQTDCKPINMSIVSIGQLDQAVVNPREVLKSAILSNASGIILFHNHPSGSLHPSNDDIRITDRMKMACDIMGIKLLDHIIVGRGQEFFSFHQKDVMPKTSVTLKNELEEIEFSRPWQRSILQELREKNEERNAGKEETNLHQSDRKRKASHTKAHE